MKIPITRPYFDEKEEKAVIKVLRSGWHTQGPKVSEFEKIFSEYVGAKHAIAVSNCTQALHLALIIAGVKKGDEVIVPSFTFIATANMIPHVGATPVFIDVDKDTFNLDTTKLEGKITQKTKAIITVDQIGLAGDLDEIKRIAKKHDVFLIEDSACAIGARYKGQIVGGLADITCFSFHPRKVISTGEGGMITTNNKDYADKARLWRNHGMTISDVERHKQKQIVYEEYLVPGFNYRMTDIQAAIGIEQMKKLPTLLELRRKLANRYQKILGKNKYLELPTEPDYAIHTWQTYLVKVKDNSPVSAKDLMQKLYDDGIGVKRGIMACHLEPVFRKTHGNVRLPVTENLVKTSLCIPLFPQMTKEEQNYIIDRINFHLR